MFIIKIISIQFHAWKISIADLYLLELETAIRYL